MKKQYLILIAAVILNCINTKAQTTIYSQNFDSLGLSLPTGWSSTASGWIMDSVTANRSNGYSGASGLFNCVIKNGAAVSGTYTLTTSAISTIGDTGITVSWAARRTTHFSDSSSSIQSFDFSIDGGTTWTNLPYTENAGNSTWAIDNAGARIMLPVAANNKPSVMFRWVANLHRTPSGTYRIDDFNLEGKSTTGIVFLTNDNSIKMYLDNANILHIEDFQFQGKLSELSIIDITGRICAKEMVDINNTNYSMAFLKSGTYFVLINNEKRRVTKKIVISNN